MSGGGKTAHERSVIRALKKLAADWPEGIYLFANSGSLKVCRAPSSDPIVIVDDISGIPCDGGDAYSERE